MIRVYCEFQEPVGGDLYWVLYIDGRPVEDVAKQLDLRDGDRVVLYGEDDFDCEVEATLHFGCTDPLFIGEKICARPDWSTQKRLR